MHGKGFMSSEMNTNVVVDDKNVKREMTSKGRPMLRAICPNCGTKMTKFTK